MTGQEGLEAANEAFYAGFEALNLDRMDRIWLHDDTVYCIHPGGEIVRGWARVRRSWAAVFASMGFVQFVVTNVQAHEVGDVGVVSCVENVLTGAASELSGGTAVATNVFVRRGGEWRMVAHHASPLLRMVEQ